MTVDAKLHKVGAPDLTALLGEYVTCCRRRQEDFTELVASLDHLSGTTLFSDQLDTFEREPGFPDYDSALRWAESHLTRTGLGPATRSRPSDLYAP